MKKLKLYISIFIMTIFIVSCGKSTYQLLYNYIGTYMHYKINKVVSLNKDQSKFIKAKISYHLDWIKDNRFKEYIKYLEELKTKVQNGLTEADMKKALQWYHKEEKIFINNTMDDVAEFLISFEKEQVEQLSKKLNKQAKRLEADLKKNDKERHEERTKFVIKAMKFGYGNFSNEQKEKIKLMTANMTDITNFKFITRKIVIKEFISKIGKGSDKEELKKHIRKWTLEYMKYIPENHKNDIRSLQNQYNSVFVSINNEVVTDKQKKRAIKKIDKFIQILKYIQDDDELKIAR